MSCIKGLTPETCEDVKRNKFNVILTSEDKSYCETYCDYYMSSQEIKTLYNQYVNRRCKNIKKDYP